MPVKDVSRVVYLQNAATADGNGTQGEADGVEGAIQLEVQETGGGTANLALQGSFDGITWYAVGYYQVSGNANLVRSVATITVTASLKSVYQVLDPYLYLRAVQSGTAGGAIVTAKLYLVS